MRIKNLPPFGELPLIVRTVQKLPPNRREKDSADWHRFSIGNSKINETSLFAHVSEIIESRKSRAGAYANREVTMMYWEVWRYIGSVLMKPYLNV